MSPTLETKWNQPDIWGAGVSSLTPAPHATQPWTFSFLCLQRQSNYIPKIPILLSWGIPEFSAKVVSGPPQIPPVPYNRSVNVSSTPTVPSQDPHNRRSTRPPRNPPEQCSPGSAHPQPALLSLQSAREAKKPVPAPLTASSFLRAASLHRPAVRSPGPSPALPPAPRPWAPAAAARRLRTGGAQSARPSRPGRPLPPLLPQPSAAQPAATNSGRGRQRPGGAARTGGGGAAPSSLLAAAPSSPGAPGLPGAGARGAEARSVRPAARGGPPRAAVVGSAPLGPAPPAPPNHRCAPEDLGAKKLPGGLQLGLYCGWRDLAARPIHRLHKAALSAAAQETFVAGFFFFFFFNEL